MEQIPDSSIPVADLVRRFRAICYQDELFKRCAGIRLFHRLRAEDDREVLRHFLLAFNAYDTHYDYVRLGGDQVRHAASFRVAMSQRTRRFKRLGIETCPEWMIWEKSEGLRFADVLGLPRPRTLAIAPRAETGFAAGTVIKPLTGSQSHGVYLLFDESRIYDASRHESFAGWDELGRRLDADLASGRIRQDLLLTEELVVDRTTPAGIPRDWKFLSFYGEVVLCMTVERAPVVRVGWVTADGTPVDLGYPPPEPELDPEPPPPALLEAARRISLEVPAPFLRIDLLKTADGYAFGEFTPRPNRWHRNGRAVDLLLGDAYLAAEARLQADLLNGKEFGAWKRFAAAKP